VRAFTLDADLDCVFDRHQTALEPAEHYCNLWPGAVEAGWQRPSCCAALTTVMGRLGMIHNGPIPNCMANDVFGGCKVPSDSRQSWSSHEYHDVLVSDDTFRKATMSLCQGRKKDTCVQSSVHGLLSGLGASPQVAYILGSEPTDDGTYVPPICTQKCRDQWEQTEYMTNAKVGHVSFEDNRLVTVELRCNRGYVGYNADGTESDHFNVSCYMLTGIAHHQLHAKPYCQKRKCKEHVPKPEPGVLLYCNNDGSCDPRCINGQQIRYALPYECDFANDYEMKWIGSGQCADWAPCTIPDFKYEVPEHGGCWRDDKGALSCRDGEFDIHCGEGEKPTGRLRCSQSSGSPDWPSVPVCVSHDNHEGLTEVTDLTAQIVIASGDRPIHDGKRNFQELFRSAIEDAAHDFGHDVKVYINRPDTSLTTAFKLHLRLHDRHYNEERKLHFRGFGRELGERGKRFKERIEQRIRDENDENRIRVHISEITFATMILPHSWVNSSPGPHPEPHRPDPEHPEPHRPNPEHPEPHRPELQRKEPEPYEVKSYGGTQFERFQVYVVYGEWCLARFSALPKSMWCRDADDHRERAWGCFCDERFGAFSAAWWKDWTNKGRECYKTLGREMNGVEHSPYLERCRENFLHQDIWARSHQVQEEQQEHGGMISRSLRGRGRREGL